MSTRLVLNVISLVSLWVLVEFVESSRVHNEQIFPGGFLLCGFPISKDILNRVHPLSGVKRFDIVNDFDSLAFWQLFLLSVKFI